MRVGGLYMFLHRDKKDNHMHSLLGRSAVTTGEFIVLSLRDKLFIPKSFSFILSFNKVRDIPSVVLGNGIRNLYIDLL